MKLLSSKVVSGCVLFLVTLFCGVVPFALIRSMTDTGARHGGSTASRLNSLQSFASGIFLATCLLHLLPEAREAIDDSLKSDLPISEMIVSFGFLLLLVVENLILSCHDAAPKESTSTHRDRSHHEKNSVVVFTRQSSLNTHKDSSQGEAENNSAENSTKVNITYGTIESRSDDDRSQNTRTLQREETGNDKTPAPHGSEDSDDENSALLNFDEEKVLISPQKRVNEIDEDIRDVKSRRVSRAQSPVRSETENKKKGVREVEHPTDDKTAVLKSFVLLFALSLHTVFDGLVVGLQKELAEVWTLLSAVALHKALVSVSIALSLVESHRHHPRSSVVYLVLFSLVAPVGLVIGVVVTETDFDAHVQTLTSGVLQSVATGTFMYVTFVESLKGRFDGGNRLLNVLLVLLGFGCVCGLKIALPD